MESKIKRLSKLMKQMNNKSNWISKHKKEFDGLIIDIYGFHYSDKDIDSIIDSIDYGQGYLEFEEFDKIMREEKINFPNKFKELKNE